MSRRLVHLDGLRALAALYVLLNHLWFTVYEAGRIEPTGLMRLGSVVSYGHFAVAAFIVVSGYSLTLATVQHDGRLPGGAGRFLVRRFWRIVPPYWAALGLSVLLGLTLLREPTSSAVWNFAVPFSWGDVAAHAALLQDLWHPGKINYVLWTIAVEWHIYLVFPAALLLLRRVRRPGAWMTTTVIVCLLIALGTGSEDRTLLPKLFLVGCFVLGMAACRVVHRGGTVAWRGREIEPRWSSIAGVVLALSALGFVLGIPNALADLGVAAALCALLVSLGTGGLPLVRRLLEVPVLAGIGTFSYSLYLVHPLVVQGLFVLLRDRLASPSVLAAVLLAAGVPAALVCSWLFFLAAERPFLRARRPWSGLRTRPRPVPLSGGIA